MKLKVDHNVQVKNSAVIGNSYIHITSLQKLTSEEFLSQVKKMIVSCVKVNDEVDFFEASNTHSGILNRIFTLKNSEGIADSYFKDGDQIEGEKVVEVFEKLFIYEDKRYMH